MANSVLLYSGLNPQVVHIDENDGASANDWYDGDLVKTDAGGEVCIATAGAMLGIARKTATGVDNTDIPVELLDIHSIYTSRVASGTTTAETYIGDILDFTFTAGAHTLAIGGTTDVYCVGLHPVDGALDGGRILYRFLYSIFTGCL